MFEGYLEELLLRAQARLEGDLQRAKDQAQAEVPVKTGRLRDSISVEVTRQGDRIEGRLSTSAPYAARIEYGPNGGFMYRAVQAARGMWR